MATPHRAFHQALMPILHAIVLGIVQGLSEFLPISSSGHLLLVPWLFGWEELTRNPSLNKAFDVALHIGTFAGAVAYFRTDLLRLARAGLASIARRRAETFEERLAWLLLLSSVPGALVGAALEGFIEEHLGAPWLIAVMLIVFGFVLLWADRLPERREEEAFGWRDALLMGTAQACALQPGVSRSGATISMSRALGFNRDAAARLSFLMSMPITGGAAAYAMADLFFREGGIPPGFGGAFFWGIVASGITGFAAVWAVLRYIRTRSFAPFVLYRVTVGVAVLGIVASPLR